MVSHRVSLNVVHQHGKRAPACTSTSFYKLPTSSSTFKLSADGLANATIPVQWDPACLPDVKAKNNDLAEIYLYNPKAKEPLVHHWTDVTFSAGTANLQVNPEWKGWDKAKEVTLQLTIVGQGDLPFLSPVPPGPYFKVEYDESKPPTSLAANSDDTTDYSGKKDRQIVAERELSKGKIAAGILIPLIFIALAVFGYIKYQRRKARKARDEWTEKVDRRMSVVSHDWKSMTVTGAQAGIRASMAGSTFNVTDGGVGVRRSGVGEIRPVSSVYAPEMNGAGVGAAGHGGYYGVDVGADGAPVQSPTSAEYLNSRSPGVGLRSTAYSNTQIAQRVSRVSFADSVGPRPSGETRRSVYSTYERKSRAFHQGHVPPVPTGLNRSTATLSHYGVEEEEDNNVAVVSPKQRDGARTLTPDDISMNARAISTYADEGGDDVAPALSMMRAQAAELNAHIVGHPDDAEDEQAQYAAMPSFPVPTLANHLNASSPAFNSDPTLFTASPVTATFPSAGSPFSPNAPLGIAPLSPNMRSQTLPAPTMAPAPVAMSPDEMLRAYAERAKSPPIGGSASRGSTPVGAGRGRSGTVTNMMGGLGGPVTMINTNVTSVVEPAGNGVMSPTRGAYGVSSEAGQGEGYFAK
ncbi:hypothetical protein PM082_005104 [Marasmius tenuissimus]|nr:hypothetical protein PM082_005104 [Marasmius tenuissimus]